MLVECARPEFSLTNKSSLPVACGQFATELSGLGPLFLRMIREASRGEVEIRPKGRLRKKPLVFCYLTLASLQPNVEIEIR